MSAVIVAVQKDRSGKVVCSMEGLKFNPTYYLLYRGDSAVTHDEANSR